MLKVKFKANLKRFAASAPEDGNVGYITNSLALAGEELAALAAVCKEPEKTLAALKATKATGGKYEVLAGKNICVLTVKVGSKKHESQGVSFRKVMLDSRGGECQMRISYQEPKTNEGGSFYFGNLGAEMEVSSAPTQKTLQEEIDEKAKGKAKGGDGDDEE